MLKSITHRKVPVASTGLSNEGTSGLPERRACLGPNGSAEHVARTLNLISGRWKLAILFRLFADTSLRSSQLLRDLPDLSQKMLTQSLRGLQRDGLVERRDFDQQPPHVEYRLTTSGRHIIPVLHAMREFSRLHVVLPRSSLP
jgi:DNA-binding HxlR family transcriptional regulator